MSFFHDFKALDWNGRVLSFYTVPVIQGSISYGQY